jgi:hypothetical protein
VIWTTTVAADTLIQEAPTTCGVFATAAPTAANLTGRALISTSTAILAVAVSVDTPPITALGNPAAAAPRATADRPLRATERDLYRVGVKAVDDAEFALVVSVALAANELTVITSIVQHEVEITRTATAGAEWLRLRVRLPSLALPPPLAFRRIDVAEQ